MKVFYLGKKLEKIVTGGERQVYEFLDYIEKMGDSVCFINLKNSRNIFKDYISIIKKINSFKNHEMTDKTIIIGDYSQRFYIFLPNLYLKLIKRAKIALLIGAFNFDYRQSRLKNLIDLLITYLFFFPGDLIMTTGKVINNRLKKMGLFNKAIIAIYPALRQELITEALTTCRNSNENNNIDTYNLITVGRFHPVKGYEHLIEAISLLKEHNINLWIVGDTQRNRQYTEKIMALIKKFDLNSKVKIIGAIDKDSELAKLYNSAHIYIHSSTWETSPVSVCEGILFGLPVIATDVGGTSEYLEDGVDSILVPPKDPAALANAIHKLIINKKLYLEYANNAFKSRTKFLSRRWSDVAEEYYQALMTHV